MSEHGSAGLDGTHADGCYTWGPRHWACALAEIERLRAEVAEAGRRYADSESRVAACDAALQDTQAERDALRERIEKAPSIELSREDWLDHYERVSPSYIGKRVALVVLD